MTSKNIIWRGETLSPSCLHFFSWRIFTWGILCFCFCSYRTVSMMVVYFRWNILNSAFSFGDWKKQRRRRQQQPSLSQFSLPPGSGAEMAAVKSVITFCSAVHGSVQLPVWLSTAGDEACIRHSSRTCTVHTQTDARDRIALLTDVIVLSATKSVCIQPQSMLTVRCLKQGCPKCFVFLNGQNWNWTAPVVFYGQDAKWEILVIYFLNLI